MRGSTVDLDRGDRLARLARDAAIGAMGGTIAGILAGFGARVAMRIFAVETRSSVSMSFGGTLTILFFGVILGLGVGMIYGLTRRAVPGPTVLKGLLFGGILTLALVVPALLSQPGEAAPDVNLGLALFAPLAVAFGVATALAVAVLDRRELAFDGLLALVGALALAGGVIGALVIGSATIGLYAKILDGLIR
jgi:hypothetical protein